MLPLAKPRAAGDVAGEVDHRYQVLAIDAAILVGRHRADQPA